jgi:hypothetical protein
MLAALCSLCALPNVSALQQLIADCSLNNLTAGPAVPQFRQCWILIAESQVPSPVTSCELHGRRSGAEADFLPSFFLYFPHIIIIIIITIIPARINPQQSLYRSLSCDLHLRPGTWLLTE